MTRKQKSTRPKGTVLCPWFHPFSTLARASPPKRLRRRLLGPGPLHA